MRLSIQMPLLLSVIACSTVTCSDQKAESLQQRVNPIELTNRVLDIGGNDELMHPAWATRLANGTIAVADIFAYSILFFDKDGTFIRRAGRQGFGPGEYQAPAWVDTCSGDSLFVLDAMQSRISVLDTTGKAVRHFTMPPLARLACAPNSESIAFIAPPSEPMRAAKPNGKRKRYLGELQIADTEGDVRKSIGKVPLEEGGPLGRIASISMSDEWLWYGSADSGYVELYSVRGKRLGLLNLRLPKRAATRRHVDMHIDRMASNFRDERTRERNRQYWDNFPTPEYLPSFSRLLADPDGNLWAVTSSIGDSITELRGVSPDGSIVAHLTLNLAMDVFEVGSDYIIGSYELDGQPRVAVYQFIKTAASR